MSASQEHQILAECRDYVTAHGNDTETSDYYRLQANVWDILGSDPYMGPVDEILGYLNLEAEVHDNKAIPGLHQMGSPDRGASVSDWIDHIEADIRASLGELTWKGIYS